MKILPNLRKGAEADGSAPTFQRPDSHRSDSHRADSQRPDARGPDPRGFASRGSAPHGPAPYGSTPHDPEPRRPPADGRWDPIVVDQAIQAFEPRPPAGRSYRADTVFDGWSTDALTMRVASVRGYSHRHQGTPRQDCAEAAFHEPTGTVLFAVADGVSEAQQGEIGAAVVCRVAVDQVRRSLDGGWLPDWDAVVRAASDQLSVRCGQLLGVPRPGLTEVAKVLATTLVIGVAGPTPRGIRVALARVGDSSAWLLERHRFYPVFAGRGYAAPESSPFGVSALPHVPSPVPTSEFMLSSHAVLLVGSDGFGDPLGDGDGHVGRLFADTLATPPPARGLAHLLDFSREAFDGDRTLLALWPRSYRSAPA